MTFNNTSDKKISADKVIANRVLAEKAGIESKNKPALALTLTKETSLDKRQRAINNRVNKAINAKVILKRSGISWVLHLDKETFVSVDLLLLCSLLASYKERLEYKESCKDL